MDEDDDIVCLSPPRSQSDFNGSTNKSKPPTGGTRAAVEHDSSNDCDWTIEKDASGGDSAGGVRTESGSKRTLSQRNSGQRYFNMPQERRSESQRSKGQLGISLSEQRRPGLSYSEFLKSQRLKRAAPESYHVHKIPTKRTMIPNPLFRASPPKELIYPWCHIMDYRKNMDRRRSTSPSMLQDLNWVLEDSDIPDPCSSNGAESSNSNEGLLESEETSAAEPEVVELSDSDTDLDVPNDGDSIEEIHDQDGSRAFDVILEDGSGRMSEDIHEEGCRTENVTEKVCGRTSEEKEILEEGCNRTSEVIHEERCSRISENMACNNEGHFEIAEIFEAPSSTSHDERTEDTMESLRCTEISPRNDSLGLPNAENDSIQEHNDSQNICQISSTSGNTVTATNVDPRTAESTMLHGEAVMTEEEPLSREENVPSLQSIEESVILNDENTKNGNISLILDEPTESGRTVIVELVPSEEYLRDETQPVNNTETETRMDSNNQIEMECHEISETIVPADQATINKFQVDEQKSSKNVPPLHNFSVGINQVTYEPNAPTWFTGTFKRIKDVLNKRRESNV